MMYYPEVQRKAQAEIEAVIGNDRLPDFSDRDSLPYIEAVLKELLRFHTVIPSGAPCLSGILLILIMIYLSQAPQEVRSTMTPMTSISSPRERQS